MENIITKPWFRIVPLPNGIEESMGTLVAFSGYGRKANKFCFYKSSYEGQIARLMFNCDKTWYLEGIPDFSNCVEDTTEKISNLLMSSGSKNSLFIGGSMGGFGALLYGSACNAKRIICFATEVIANIPGGRRQLVSTSPYINLKAFVERSQSSIDLFVGERNYADIFSAFYLNKLVNVKVHLIADSGHAVASTLKIKGVLKKIIGSGLTNQKLDLPKEIYSSSKLYKFLNQYDYDSSIKSGNSGFINFISTYITYYLDHKPLVEEDYLELTDTLSFPFIIKNGIFYKDKEFKQMYSALFHPIIKKILQKSKMDLGYVSVKVFLPIVKVNYYLGNYDFILNLTIFGSPEYEYWKANAAIRIGNNKIAYKAAKEGYMLMQNHPKKDESSYIGLTNALHKLIQTTERIELKETSGIQ